AAVDTQQAGTLDLSTFGGGTLDAPPQTGAADTPPQTGTLYMSKPDGAATAGDAVTPRGGQSTGDQNLVFGTQTREAPTGDTIAGLLTRADDQTRQPVLGGTHM